MNEDPSVAAQAQQESPGGVLGLGVGIAVIAAAALLPLIPLAGDLDPGEFLRTSFGVQGQLPHGLVPVRAVSFAGGEQVVLLRHPERSSLEHDAPQWELPTKDKRGGFGRGSEHKKKPETFDWTVVPVVEDGGAPVEVALALFPTRKGAKVVESQFHGLGFEDATRLPKSGKTVPVDSGYLDWGSYEAPFIQLRHYGRDESGPGFWDTLRVNLTVESKARILYLRWPRGQAGHRDRASEILQVLPVSPGT